MKQFQTQKKEDELLFHLENYIQLEIYHSHQTIKIKNQLLKRLKDERTLVKKTL
jgi:hypothetical protein